MCINLFLVLQLYIKKILLAPMKKKNPIITPLQDNRSMKMIVLTHTAKEIIK